MANHRPGMSRRRRRPWRGRCWFRRSCRRGLWALACGRLRRERMPGCWRTCCLRCWTDRRRGRAAECGRRSRRGYCRCRLRGAALCDYLLLALGQACQTDPSKCHHTRCRPSHGYQLDQFPAVLLHLLRARAVPGGCRARPRASGKRSRGP
jgi:hypothetical protein